MVQAVSGMAGGIIVYGAIDEVPEIKAARDILIVMQDIALFPIDPGLPPQALGLPAGPDIWGYWTFCRSRTRSGRPSPARSRSTIRRPSRTGRPNCRAASTGDYKLRYYLVNGRPFFKEMHNTQTPQSGQPAPTRFLFEPMTIKVAPGEVVRFRMLNGNSDNKMPIAVKGHQVHLIAL